MIRLIEIKKSTYDRQGENVQYKLEEVWINPKSVLQIRPDASMKNNLQAGYLPQDLDSRQEFSRVHVGGGNSVSVMTVVGSPPTVIEKMDTANKQLLKG
jgi:hypothetical protein